MQQPTNNPTNPTDVTLEITKKCNFACKFCSIVQNPKISELPSKKPLELINQIIHLTSSFQTPFNLKLTGGEPFLVLTQPLVSKLLTEIPNLNHITVYTNGYILPDSSLFPDPTQITIKVSLYGKKTFHEKITDTPNTFSTIIENIRELKRRNFNVELTSPIFNLHESLKLADLSKKLDLPLTLRFLYGSPDPSIQPLQIIRQEKIATQMQEINPNVHLSSHSRSEKIQLSPIIKFTGKTHHI